MTLWREAANLEARAGDYTEVTDCVINVYKSETSLSTTVSSTVLKVDAPVEEEGSINVEGVSVEGDVAELLTSGDKIVTVPAELLLNVVEMDDIEMLTEAGPVKVQLTRKGSEIVDVKVL